MIIIGIDTDTRGSIARLDTGTNELTIFAVPNHFEIINKSKRLRVHKEQLADVIKHMTKDADHVFLEQQNARPNQGVTSVFTFGQVYGTLIGMTYSSCPPKTQIHFVTGAKWKNSMQVTKDKKATVNMASRLAPQAKQAWKLVKYTSAAEAFLICLYGCGMVGQAVQRIPITLRDSCINNISSLR